MATTNKIILGFLILTLAIAGIYVELTGANVKLYVQNDYSTFYVKNQDTNRWEISGRETNSLYNGSSKLTRTLSDTYVNYTFDNATNITTVFRHTAFAKGPTIIDTYTFRSDLSDVNVFPIRHQVEIFNAVGKIYQYDVSKLVYSGETIPSLAGIQSYAFGKQMKVTWDPGNYYSKLLKYSGRDEGKLTIKYKITSDYVSYDVRLFDPYPASWTKCKNITINNPTSTALVNFPVNLT